MFATKKTLDERIVDSAASRAIVVIASGVLLCLLAVGATLSQHQKSVRDSSSMLNHTYKVMTVSMTLAADLQRMMISARGYLISDNADFNNDYRRYLSKSQELTDELARLTSDNPVQVDHMARLRALQEKLLNVLEEERRVVEGTRARGERPVIDTTANALNLDIQQLLDRMMEEEDRLLTLRLERFNTEQARYDQLLYGGIGLAALVIILLNALVLKLNARKDRLLDASAKAEERLALAMRSTSDGIFDWNIASNEMYYSPRFKHMLGYRDDELPNELGAIEALIHEDDLEAVRHDRSQYLEGKTSELNIVCRMRHKTDGYLWLHTRARATFDEQGKPLRLIGAAADITSIKAIEERLRVEKELAVRANRAKTDFLTNMSHEIRTPLNAIIGVSGILASKMVKDPEQEALLISTLQHSSVSLLDLINDILDLAKIESGEIDLEYKRFPLDGLMQQIASIIAVRAQEKQLEFLLKDAPVQGMHYVGDEGRLRQILINLVGNALKFSEKGKVELEVTLADGEILFRVADSGIGIAESDLHKIFLKFEQADSSTTRKYGGTGLGLAISQKLTQTMGGRIEVVSRLGEGSVFTLIMPDNTQDTSDARTLPAARPLPK